MLKVVLYLLPISGMMLLRELNELNSVQVSGAFLPEKFPTETTDQRNFLEEANIPYSIPSELDSPRVKKWLQEKKPDIAISVGYDKLLPKFLIETPPLGTVNMHPALLPEYRGANPYFWVIKNREPYSGATLHLMDENFDTGPILSRHRVELDLTETVGELFYTLNELGCTLIVELLKQINDDGMPEAKKQREVENLPQAPRVQEKHLRIDWNKKYEEIEAHVRAGNPFFGAQTTFRGAELKIYEVERADFEQKASPGSIKATDSGPLVRCADGWVKLKSVCMGHYYQGSGKMFQKREQQALSVLSKVI